MARDETLTIGKIVRSESHVRYTCQVYCPGEVAAPPQPSDYAFGSFVRVPLRINPFVTFEQAALRLGSERGSNGDRERRADRTERGPASADLLDVPALTSADVALVGDGPYGIHAGTWAIGLIYDTILLNPAFGTLGPRLSTDDQVALFSPDYVTERAVLVSILLLGTMAADLAGHAPLVSHGVPSVAPDLGAEVAALPDAAIRAFHSFADGEAGPGGPRPYLHMGYLPHAIAQENPLLPLALLRTIERLERLLPENAALLSIVKRNFAWRLKVQTAG